MKRCMFSLKFAMYIEDGEGRSDVMLDQEGDNYYVERLYFEEDTSYPDFPKRKHVLVMSDQKLADACFSFLGDYDEVNVSDRLSRERFLSLSENGSVTEEMVSILKSGGIL